MKINVIKVAGYCRVSTDKEDQANSFESQQRYFREYIRNHPGWELFEIYADEGISGTNTKKRTQFNRMINDAYEGKFHLIITKEVSRFSRNILDTIAYTRELRAIGIGVIFANDRINTLEPEAEMLLSFLASLAQEESRRTSSRVVWGQTRQMEQGVVFGRSLLGYDVKNGVMSINEEGAEIVRMIFQMYAIDQIGTCEIARYLTSRGYCTNRGNNAWKSCTIVKVLKNEKYVGDLLQKKTYTPDYLTHVKKANRGQVPFIAIENHHEPIISRDIWNMAQERLQQNNKRGEYNGGHSNRYVFSGKIRCGECGNSFVGRFKYLKDGSRVRRWSCGKAACQGSVACDVGKLVRDDDALQMLKTSIRHLPLDLNAIKDNLTQIILRVIRSMECDVNFDRKRIQHELDQLKKKKETVMDCYFSDEITSDEMQIMKHKYDCQITSLHQRQQEMQHSIQEKQDRETLRNLISAEISCILNCEYESNAFYKALLESLTVYKDRHMELRLKKLPQVFIFSG